MNSNRIKPEKLDHIHLIFHFTVPLNFKAFSPDSEIIEGEQVIEMLDKPVMFNCGQIMFSKSQILITLCKHLLSVLSGSSVLKFSNCMFLLLYSVFYEWLPIVICGNP